MSLIHTRPCSRNDPFPLITFLSILPSPIGARPRYAPANALYATRGPGALPSALPGGKRARTGKAPAAAGAAADETPGKRPKTRVPRPIQEAERLMGDILNIPSVSLPQMGALGAMPPPFAVPPALRAKPAPMLKDAPLDAQGPGPMHEVKKLTLHLGARKAPVPPAGAAAAVSEPEGQTRETAAGAVPLDAAAAAAAPEKKKTVFKFKTGGGPGGGPNA